jgi:hypothetical protein
MTGTCQWQKEKQVGETHDPRALLLGECGALDEGRLTRLGIPPRQWSLFIILGLKKQVMIS